MYVFSQEAKELLFSILVNSGQMEKLNDLFSDCEIVNHGVPQGTVLGSLIFLLYVNDFSSKINTAEKIIQFADDTIVCCGQKSSLHGKVTEILQKTEEYVEMNKLTLNTNKTELIFSRAIIFISDLFFRKTKFSQHKKVAYILVFNLTGILVSMNS